MSTGIAPAVPLDGGPRLPSYASVFRVAALAQFAGAACLLLIALLVSLTSVFSLSASSESVYAPWIVDGPWPLLASIGWGFLVSALIGGMLRFQLAERTGARVSRTLTQASVALGGYGPWLATSSSGGRVLLSLLAIPAVLRVLAFDRAGDARRLPRGGELAGRTFAVALVVAVVALVAPFMVLHPFVTSGGGSTGVGAGPTADDGIHRLHRGARLVGFAGLSTGSVGLTVTGVRLLGPTSGLRLDGLTLSLGAPAPGLAPRARLPFHVPAGRLLWVSYGLRLARCTGRPAGVTGVVLRYRALGLALTQTVSLGDQRTLLACR